jgi:hypothetical protein
LRAPCRAQLLDVRAAAESGRGCDGGRVSWLVLHLAAVAVLTGVAWVVQLVVYPAFRLVGPQEWAPYHEAHRRAITWVVVLPWALQGGSSVALLLAPPFGGRPAAVALIVLALVTVVATSAVAVPAHNRLSARPDARDLAALLRANLVRTLAWTGSTALAAALLLA